jgi:tetratricopeptide (TPR) repeat protein
MKCLARNPADRYQDAAKLAADLRKPARKSFPARRLVVGLASLLLAAVIGLAVFFQQHTPTSDQPNEPATASKNDEAPSPAPGSLEAALALGKLHFNRKEWGEAETAFSEAIRLDPDCAEAYHLRAGSLFNAGKVKESLPDFDKAVALDPHNAELFKNRGIARLNLLRFDEALADLRHGLELDPENPEPYRKVLGETFARRAFEHDRAKKWKEAVADMNEAIRHRPAFADNYDKRGSFHYNLGQFEEALKDFSEAIRLDPKQPAFFLHRGYAHQALGREDEAAEDFAKAQRAGGHSDASERLQRKTAEAILRGQGAIRVQGFGQPVTSLIGLPPGPVRIESADFPPGQPVDVAVLQGFQSVPSLFALNLSQTQVTDDDLRFLRGLTGLRILRLNHTGITDKGLVHLTAIPNLEFLELKGTAITDEGMDAISRIEKLAWLEISETGITDQGLRRWKKQPGLQVLRANRNSRIGAAGLYLLELVGTSVTPAAVEALRADLPTCEVRR